MSLLSLIERDTRLRKVSGTRGGEYHGPCPFCGGRDRFIVQPGRGERGKWSCRQCSPRWQDDIAYLMQRDHIGFVEARERLHGGASGLRLLPKRDPTPPPRPTTLCNPDWQAAALAFVGDCFERLRGPEGADARAYLTEQRGLAGGICVAHALGYNDRDRRATWGGVKVYLPRGIVIPWRVYGSIYRVNIRRPSGEPKYLQAAGGTNCLYRGDCITPGATVVLVEGEIDALSVLHGAYGLCSARNIVPVATGSATGARLADWSTGLLLADAVLLAFDDDGAGDGAAHWWQTMLGERARRLRPTRHDVNAMLTAGDDVAAWVGEGQGLRAED